MSKTGAEMKKVQVKVTYRGPADPDVEKKVNELMFSIGAVWYAQGRDMATGVRDIVYDLEIDG